MPYPKINLKRLYMEHKEIRTQKELLRNLEQLYDNKSYIFRGHPSSHVTFSLKPIAFREDGIKKLSEKFPMYHPEWFYCDKVREWIRLFMGDERFISSIFVKRIYYLTIYIMKYNYSLANHVLENPEKFDSHSKKMYDLRKPNYWIDKETFLYLFHNGLNQAIGCIGFDGKILKESKLSETLAGYDESLPQHYDVPTVALDWTYNPYVALYFALQNIPKNTSYVSIYAYKEINNSEKNPIAVSEGNRECKNERIICQEGTFTYMKYACSYFLLIGEWPKMEVYASQNCDKFRLINFVIPIYYINDLNKLLDEKGINKEKLFPDLKVTV
jgi:hypothetical protein